MQDCVFCKIINGQLPIYKLYEDENFLAFLDTEPINKGQSLVIPKEHYRWVDDVPNFGDYFEVAKKIGLSIKKALSPLAICYVTLGFSVPHAHIRIIPRFENDGHRDGLNFGLYKEVSQKEMQVIAAKIQKKLSV